MTTQAESTRPLYKIIYADPPWHYRNYADSTASRWVGNHYPVLGKEEIASLPIASVADNDCALFLWTTPPCLQEALYVVQSWGFQYKTKAFCWVKQNKSGNGLFVGMGYWTRSNTEDCWLATRGRPKRVVASVRQPILAPVSGHSVKPPEVRQQIEKLMGDVPRLELFAREKHDGWDCVGDAIDGQDIRVSLARIIAEQEGY